MGRRWRIITATGLAISVLTSAGAGMAQPVPEPAAQARARQFTAAAREFGVPENILLAISYDASRWTPHGEGPSNDNGFGLMNLRSSAAAIADGHGRGLDAAPKTVEAPKASRYALEDAAKALKLQSDSLKTDEQQNIRGAAASLAQYARQLNGGTLPKDNAGWYSAVAAYSGPLTQQQAQRYADGVYDVLRKGARHTTADGQELALQAEPAISPDRSSVSNLGLTAATLPGDAADCPTTLNCTFVPAAYAANGSDPTDYGNYDTANRPADMPVRNIVIHDTEGSYSGTISWFQNPKSYVSAHYVIRSSDGAVTQMVRPDDIAWTAGNWHTNMHSINIEHEGFAKDGATWYTDAMYRSSAELVKYLSARYGIPLDRQHIIGHDHVSGLNATTHAGQHYDPGPYWDWNRYMQLVTGTAAGGSPVSATTKVLTVLPNFATNKPAITTCSRGKNCTQPAQGANIVYLRTQPSASAALLNDKYLHSTKNSTGTTLISDWSATATSGSQYAYAGNSGTWTAVWYGGQKGWFDNPAGTNQKAVTASGRLVTPRPGLTSVNVYGASYPAAAAFPSAIPVQTLSPLYTIPAGQSYVINDTAIPDYYYAATHDSSKPADHTVVIGGDAYYQISFNHRVGYVKAADVAVSAW